MGAASNKARQIVHPGACRRTAWPGWPGRTIRHDHPGQPPGAVRGCAV